MRTLRTRLAPLAPLAALGFLPPPAGGQEVADTAHYAATVFQTGDRCVACHQGVVTPAGEDVSIGLDWRASMMANSARDPYWQAAVRREITDHPQAREAIEDKCSTCHMPMARMMAVLEGGTGDVFANLPAGASPARHALLAADGVSCSACHQIRPEGLGEPWTFTGGFQIDSITPWGTREIFGPFEVDAGRRTVMRSAVGYEPTRADHVQRSELCASCHTLYTHALDDQGNEVGELPEQVPYLEWRHSAFPDEGRSCQDCHMPVVEHDVPVTGILAQPRQNVSRHVFRGGNFFMLGVLNRYRDELGVTALPQELDANRARTLENLAERTARLELASPTVEGDELRVDVRVENRTGHKLPTAYPSRRAWVHLRVLDADGRTVFESGAVRADGSIDGNDNDADPRAFEPHWEEITSPEQVQIYEAILLDWRDEVTTGLLYGVRYGKDNRVLPRGFDKATAEPDIAVQGRARPDADFRDGADRVAYRIALNGAPGPFRVEADLYYQPVGFRWARNLAEYDAMETRRFVRYYDSMAGASWAPLAQDRVEVGR